MSINVNDIFEDVLDRVNQPENGLLTTGRYNRFSWIAQLNLIDWLSGDVSNQIPPEPYLSQKNKDWLSPFIVPYPVQVINGIVTKPSDYYRFENAYLLGQFNDVTNCSDPIVNTGVSLNTSIEILDGDKFTERGETYIVGLQPSFKRPISKIVGNNFVFNPTDLGSITIEYIRYPQKSKLAMKPDTQFNDEVYDPANSVDFEWGEYARSLLVWYIADLFFDFTREQAGKQFNTATGKLSREVKA